MPSRATMSTFAAAEEYLSKAKNGSRPLGSTGRLYPIDADTIGVRLHNTTVVQLRRDGNFVIHTGGWNTTTTRRWIHEYSPARIFSERKQLHIVVANPELSPPRVTKCRTCKNTGTEPMTCYGPSWCHYAGAFGERCQHGFSEPHREERCEHSRTSVHPNGFKDCWRCKGTGMADYGSKPLHPVWNGKPILIDSKGLYLSDFEGSAYPAAQALSYAPVAPKPKAKHSIGGDQITKTLARAVPALKQRIRCPGLNCCHGHEHILENLIVHLNDTARWSREQIADWLETLSVDIRINPLKESA